MLTEMIDELINAKDKKELERAFKALEKVGMDRMTARIVARERLNERKRGAK